MSNDRVVGRYFDREAERFDAIYEDDKPTFQRWLDRTFRQVVRHRLELVRVLAPLPGEWSVLDVGCGSGRFAISLAGLGATRVVGIDIAERMIELARSDAEQKSVQDQCSFEVTEYLAFHTDEIFDVVLALGYFDYLDDPQPHLQKMLGQCRTRLFASFPKRFDARVPTRLLRIRMGGGYVRFYSRGDVLALVRASGVPRERFTLVDLGRDYFLMVNQVGNEPH